MAPQDLGGRPDTKSTFEHRKIGSFIQTVCCHRGKFIMRIAISESLEFNSLETLGMEE